MNCCRRCGCRLARDHQDDDLCSPCLGSVKRDFDPPSRDEPWYDPRDDPFFRDKLLACLSSSPGVRLEPHKVMGIDPIHRYYIRDQIKALRRQGFVITAVPRVSGYKYLGYVETSHIERLDSSLDGEEA